MRIPDGDPGRAWAPTGIGETDSKIDTMTQNPALSIQDAVAANPDADKTLNVAGRGRPEREPRDAARRILSRQHFGAQLRSLREGVDLSLSRAAALAGLNSSRKLSQYETTCYPPGEVVERLAPHYGVEPRELAEMVLRHSDPSLFQAITGKPGYEPPLRDIEHFMAFKKPNN